ncbi:MAG: PTS sugar transporter subunit IIA [Planifilum sp.]|jgi:fructose-specific phosphotransferase system IIA component
MEISDLIRSEWIRLDMEGESREDVIRRLAGLLDEAGVLSDMEQYIADVFEREKVGSTAIGFDVAIPHGKSDGVKAPAVAFARLTRPIRWEPGKEERAQLVFLIAVPKAMEGNEHLQILAALSRKLIDESFRQQLMEMSSPEEVLQSLQNGS